MSTRPPLKDAWENIPSRKKKRVGDLPSPETRLLAGIYEDRARSIARGKVYAFIAALLLALIVWALYPLFT
jgi:hypothetical protein